jgi:hypothetical protein
VDIAVLRQPAGETGRRKQGIGVSIGFLAIAAGFVLSTPYFLGDFQTALANIRFEARTTHTGADGLSPPGNLIWYLTQSIPSTITWPQIILLSMAYLLILMRRQFSQLLLSGYTLLFVVGISASALHWSRWLIPILPIFSIFVAFSLTSLIAFGAKHLDLTPKVERYFLVLGMGLILILPVYGVVLHSIRQVRPSTRLIAREWIIQNLPPGSKIAQEMYTAPLAGTDFEIFDTGSVSTAGYTFEDAYQLGYHHVVVSSSIYNRYLAEPNRYPDEVKFYQTLFQKGKLIRKFEPAYLQGGPVIMIYKLE